MDAEVFLSKHPVFTREDWLKNLAGSDSVRTKETKLHYYVKKGRAVRVRQGLYVSVPPGDDPLAVQPDPFLVCAKSAADSVVAYHAAMELHGRAYSLHQRFDFLTISDIRLFEFRGVSYRALDRQRRDDDVFAPRWNLIVPLKVAEQRWEEPA